MSDKHRLRLYNLPLIDSIQDLSELIHISSVKLRMASNASIHSYRPVIIQKKNSGNRKLLVPNAQSKAIQAWILRMILDQVQPSQYATAYKPGSTIKSNVEPHKFNRFFLLLDIENFFPSIEKAKVFYLFRDIGYSYEISKLLTDLCFCNYTLPQGGVTSPSLANLVVYRMDRRIAGLCSKKGIIYTRYADDITLSSNNRSTLNNLEHTITKIIRDEGFSINNKKTRFLGPNRKCMITGLVKNSSAPAFGIGKKKKNYMRCVIFNFIVNNKFVSEKYTTVESIRGWLNYCHNVDETSYIYLSRYIEHLGASEIFHI